LPRSASGAGARYYRLQNRYKRGADVARTIPVAPKESADSLEEQASDCRLRRAQLEAKLAQNAKVIDDLKRQLSEQIKVVNSLKSWQTAPANLQESAQQSVQVASDDRAKRDAELVAAQARLAEFQKDVETATAERDENAREASVLEAKVNELTPLVRSREQALDQRDQKSPGDKSYSNTTAISGVDGRPRTLYG